MVNKFCGREKKHCSHLLEATIEYSCREEIAHLHNPITECEIWSDSGKRPLSSGLEVSTTLCYLQGG